MSLVAEVLCNCAFCDGSDMVEVMDFGIVALAGGFIMPAEFDSEKRYPLRIYFCNDCCSLQVIDKIKAESLFSDYFYRSSSIATLCHHFTQYASEVVSRFLPMPSKATIIEFGCNDGVLLRPLADLGVGSVVGIDPATNIVQEMDDDRIRIINNFFTEDLAKEFVATSGKADLVLANNVYAHIPDIQDVTRAIREVLCEDGVFVFEVHYLGKIIAEMQYDMIYHEHLYYYSLLGLRRHFARYGMAIFDLQMVPTHGGSVRYFVCKNNSVYADKINPKVEQLCEEEHSLGYHRKEAYIDFAEKVENRRTELMCLLSRLKSEGNTIAGYGASGRANTIIQYCGITSHHISYMIDDSEAKIGFYTPGSHLFIQSNDVLESSDAPDYILLFAWSFLDEIIAKCSRFLKNGGKIIVPLPNVKVITKDDLGKLKLK